jgi:hypothetical protein
LPASASENKRFETTPDPFAGITFPDKFKKDGKPDLATFVTSYGELETRFNTKTEDLKKEIAAETLKDRPAAADKYTLPELKGVDPKELAEHPMVGWWREQAFEAGLPQAKFAKAIETYIDKMQPKEIPEETLKAQLGDSFKARIAAVDTWAAKTAKDAGELEAFKRIGTDPAGIKLLERLAGLSGTGDTGTPASQQPEVTLESLRSMQQDPRYWNPGQRDPNWVRQVEEGYKKLYPEKKAS